MARQLVLINLRETDWRLDERTKELGRRGVSQARDALRRVASPAPVKVGAGR